MGRRRKKNAKTKLVILFSMIIGLLILMLTFNSVPDIITTENIKEGIHYKELKSNKKIFETDKKVVAIVSLTCPHCYEFVQTFKYMQKDIEFIPVGWGKGFESLSRIMFTAKKFSNSNKVIYKLFELYKNPNTNINEAFRIIQNNSKVTLQEIKKYYGSEELDQLIYINQKNANKLPVNSVPIVIVNNKKLKIENIKGADNFKTLMNELIKN